MFQWAGWGLQGYFYVEAEKEVHVKEAVTGLRDCNP